MSTESKITWAMILLGLTVAGVLLFGPQVQEELAPEIGQAWIALEVDGSGRAEVGHRILDSGTPFTLHAVLEARRRGGRPIYYTEAPALVVEGQEVPAEALRRWDRLGTPKIRWFTVEGENPSVVISCLGALEDLSFRESFRPDWPDAWSIPGRVTPYSGPAENAAPLYDSGAAFGTQHFHVRIEVYQDEKAPVPTDRYRSWGAAELAARIADPPEGHLGDFPGVTMRLPEPLAVTSGVFGLPQIEPQGSEVAQIRERADELASRHLAFARLPLVRRALLGAGLDPSAAPWQPLDLNAGAAWGEDVSPGDLVRVLDRVVQLWKDAQDAGELGRLDPEDLCFDFVRGATVRPLRQVFSGGGEVQWLPLSAAAEP